MNGMGMRIGGGLFGGESIPAMEAALRFASQRHLVLVNNVANAHTPNFRARDLSEDGFRGALTEAIQRRTTSAAPLNMPTGRHLRRGPDGSMRFQPMQSGGAELRHNGNDVAIDQQMTNLLKNASTMQVFNRFLSRKFRMMRTAISGRIT